MLIRLDDAGSSPGANRAIREIVATGLTVSAGIMAPAPYFDGLVLGGPIEACLGVHLTLNAEWSEGKWGPLTQAPSLTDANGHFTAFPQDLKNQGYDLAEIEAELKAQIKKVKEHFEVTYCDEHMGFTWLPGIRQIVEKLAIEEGLVYAPDQPDLNVFHPAFADEVSRHWWHPGLAPLQIAAERDDEAHRLLEPDPFPGETLITYRDILGK